VPVFRGRLACATTHYDTPQVIEQSVWDHGGGLLAAGVDPAHATDVHPVAVPEHAELHLLLSMITPLGWLERMPTYKDQQEKLSGKDLSPTVSSVIRCCKARTSHLPRHQVAGGRGPSAAHRIHPRDRAPALQPHLRARARGFEEKAEAAVKKAGQQEGQALQRTARAFSGAGDDEALLSAKALLDEQQSLSTATASACLATWKAAAR